MWVTRRRRGLLSHYIAVRGGGARPAFFFLKESNRKNFKFLTKK
jgi:hypothetical protein